MSSKRGRNTEGKNSGSTVEGQNLNSSDAILGRLENLVSGNVSKLNQIISQNVEMKKSIASINTEITKLKTNLQFMDDTVNKLKDGMNQRVEVGVYEHNNPQPNVVFAETDLRSASLLPRYPT